MNMTSITVEASIFPLTNEIAIGGSNPRIFSGNFEISVPAVPEFPDYWMYSKWVRIGNVNVFVTSRSSPGDSKIKLFGNAHLQSVTPEYFAELQANGWKLEQEDAIRKGYPRTSA